MGSLPRARMSSTQLGGHVHIPGHGEVLFRVGHVHHVVGHALHLLMGGLGGADVHAAVDLHGVGGDHLAVVGRWASSTASFVLPEAVGPLTTKILGGIRATSFP